MAHIPMSERTEGSPIDRPAAAAQQAKETPPTLAAVGHDEAPPMLASLLAGNFFAAGSVIAVAFVALRLTSASDHNVSTALGLLADGGATNVVLGTFVGSPGVLVQFALFGAIVVWAKAMHETDEVPLATAALATVAALAILAAPWITGLMILVGVLVPLALQAGLARQRLRGRRLYRELLESLMTRQAHLVGHTAGTALLLTEAILRIGCVRHNIRFGQMRSRREARLRRELARLEAAYDEVRVHAATVEREIEAELQVIERRVADIEGDTTWAGPVFFRGLVAPGGKSIVARTLAPVLVTAVATSILMSAIDSRPWLPVELVTFIGAPGIVGYVVNDRSDFTTLMTHEGRQLVRMKTESIEGRRVCRIEVHNALSRVITDQRTLLSAIVGTPRREPSLVCPAA